MRNASDLIVRANLAPELVRRLSVVRSPSIDRPSRPLIIAHRGNSSAFPENTVAAIRSAFDLGADAVEVDVRLSSDGVPVIFHDDTLDQKTDGHGRPEDLTAAQLQRLDAGSWKSHRFAGARIATLEEAVLTAKGRGPLLLDLKADGLGVPVAAIFRHAGVPASNAIIGAWNAAQRAEFAAAMPGARILQVETAPLVWSSDLFRTFRAEQLWGFDFGEAWPPALIGAAVREGIPVLAYTVNDADTMRRLTSLGVSGMETDDPALLLRVRDTLGAGSPRH